MLCLNMSFNIILSWYGCIGYFSVIPLYYINKIKYISLFYFTGDTLTEIFVYKRYTYIPHHIIVLITLLNIWNNYPIYESLAIVAVSESSSFITNVRTILKEKNILSLTTDKVLYIYYNCARNIAMPMIIYRCSNYPIMYYSAWLIQCMSIYWSILWTKSIIKYQSKNTNNFTRT